jgi:hypothetical protein
MKKTNIKLYAGIFLMVFTTIACEDNLDINENPNQPTKAEVQLVLPQAIVATANLTNQFNTYGAHFGGFMANAGGFSGFGNLLNYNLTPGDWNNLWVNTYQDPLQDLNYVIKNSEGNPDLAYYNAVAKIMTVVNYQRLVDAFGNIPYSQALKADEGIRTPAYDDAFTIYQALFAKLDEAINLIQTANSAAVAPSRLIAATDPLYSELATESPADHARAWQKYANTLKLRILIRLSGKDVINPQFSSFVTTGFANLDLTLGFIDNDAIVDPGYEINRPNPEWASWGRNTAGALANSSRIPTTFIMSFYNGTKISDAIRGETIYVNYPNTPNNQLGNEDGSPTIIANSVTWASNQGAAGTNPSFIGTGVLKGAGMGQPLMLKAEAHFLIAEAQLKGYLGAFGPAGYAGNMRQSFRNGIKASFAYLFKNENESMLDTTGRFNAYLANNNTRRLVNIDLATSDLQSLEAIITQKYIALNMINSDEAWNEYRRTEFPMTIPGGAPAADIASNKSNALARVDRLPTRILYPSTEQSYNATNFVVINPVADLIFWDPN